jgi:MFS transporter, CP family, cyanate transporter
VLCSGRVTALLGIVLVALTLRQTVVVMAPILGDIRVDIPMSNIGVGLLGTLHPVADPRSGKDDRPCCRCGARDATLSGRGS